MLAVKSFQGIVTALELAGSHVRIRAMLSGDLNGKLSFIVEGKADDPPSTFVNPTIFFEYLHDQGQGILQAHPCSHSIECCRARYEVHVTGRSTRGCSAAASSQTQSGIPRLRTFEFNTCLFQSQSPIFEDRVLPLLSTLLTEFFDLSAFANAARVCSNWFAAAMTPSKHMSALFKAKFRKLGLKKAGRPLPRALHDRVRVHDISMHKQLLGWTRDWEFEWVHFSKRESGRRPTVLLLEPLDGCLRSANWLFFNQLARDQRARHNALKLYAQQVLEQIKEDKQRATELRVVTDFEAAWLLPLARFCYTEDFVLNADVDSDYKALLGKGKGQWRTPGFAYDTATRKIRDLTSFARRTFVDGVMFSMFPASGGRDGRRYILAGVLGSGNVLVLHKPCPSNVEFAIL